MINDNVYMLLKTFVFYIFLFVLNILKVKKITIDIWIYYKYNKRYPYLKICAIVQIID